MSAPAASLTALRTSTAALLSGIDAERWTDADVRAPSPDTAQFVPSAFS